MGDHYTPRKYLRGFCEDQGRGKIWAYDRLQKKWINTAVENIGQENGFYHPDDEKALNQVVEVPANPILDKLRNGGLVEDMDRAALAVYIATFLYRVPHNRGRGRAVAPNVLKSTIREVQASIRAVGEARGIPEEIIQARLTEADACEAKYQDNYPPEVLERINNPWPTVELVEVIQAMNWRVVTAAGRSLFLTSDNPAFYFDSIGFKNAESEFSFPISSQKLLHGSWQKTRQLRPVVIKEYLVKEFNRRTASRATRFLFYHERQDWIAALGNKREEHHFLSRVVWV